MNQEDMMRTGYLRGTSLVFALLGAAAVAATHVIPAAAQDSGSSPSAQVPGPNAASPEADAHAASPNIPVQPVPGAMPDSDTVPSTLSAKNAADDQLIVVAYAFKHLTPEQRRVIYDELKGSPPPGPTPSGETGVELPPQVALLPVPTLVSMRVPETTGYQYTISNNKVLLVWPATRVVMGEVAG
jgi:hypothetical protein